MYLDYTGASLYPSSLINSHTKWLKNSVAGNPHSTSPASLCSSNKADEARRAVLEFFDADPEEYDVVWTSNASGGFKIVGEAYDFRGRKVLIPRDAHNSLNSLARKAEAGGGSFEFIPFDSSSTPGGDTDTISPASYLSALSSPNKGLIFFTGQSNITGTKLDMSLLGIAKNLGWDVGLDAAALAPSTRISLRQNPVDYMVVSLYKICGYPTGLGALLLRKEQYAKLTQKSTFFGGNIVGITMDKMEFSLVEGPERFEDGTCNFLSMAAVKEGLEWAARWMPHYSRRNKILMGWLIEQLDSLHYPPHSPPEEDLDEKDSDASFSTLHSPSAPSFTGEKKNGVKLVRIGGPSSLSQRGSTLPLVFSSPTGDALNYRFVIWAAAQENISLRGGPCMCNPGASSCVMQRGLITDLEASSLLAVADVGIVRVSLGAATNFKDVWRLVHFVKKLTDERWVGEMWGKYEKEHPGSKLGNDIEELQLRATRKRT